MKNKIPSRLETLLYEVMQKRCPDHLAAYLKLGINFLPETTRFQIRQAITDEFINTGIDSNSEPTARGHDLEDLIDIFA